MDDFYTSGTYKSEKDLIKGWQEEIKKLPVSEIFYHGTLEIYAGGSLPDPTSFCGQCWQALINETPGERLIDWNFYEEDIIDFLEKLDYQKVDKKHPDYVFLSSKLTSIKCRKTANLIEGLDYTDLEISALSFTVNGNRLEIPKDIFISNYNDLKTIMKNFEGKYSKNGFDFPYPAEQVLNRIRNKETTNLKKTFQYFGTSKKLSDLLCEKVFDPYLNKSLKVCEPSAGQGAIVSAVLEWFEKKSIHCELESITAIEFMAENYQILKENFKENDLVNTIHMDFLKYDEYINYYDVVIANPPFSKNQDITHFRKMYEICKPGGYVISIMSNGFLYNSGKVHEEFRKFIGLPSDAQTRYAAKSGGCVCESESGQLFVQTIDSGEFKESGTNVATALICFRKDTISGFEEVTLKKEKPKKAEEPPKTEWTLF
ncbi:methyltransferase [Flavobacterium sp.]|uniref:methyltransferase n=1 Tax=Flavobacterium sp. TaxID=239 RepID=UPI003D6B4810